MEIVIKGTPEELKEYLQNADEETPVKITLGLGDKEYTSIVAKDTSHVLKPTNIDELENIKNQLIELYQKFIDFQVETEIAEDKE